MNTQTSHLRPWITQRRVFLFACFVVVLIFWFWAQPQVPKEEVESVGGNYAEQNLDLPAGMSGWSWSGVVHGLYQTARGKERKAVTISFFDIDVTDEWLSRIAAAMSELPIHSLGFRRTRITDHAIADIAELKSVAMLDLAETSITDLSMPTIRRMPNLQMVDLTITDVIQSGVSHLADHSMLRYLHVDGDVLTRETVTHLVAMPRLSSLGITAFNGDQLGRPAEVKKLRALSLTAVTDEALPIIFQLKILVLNDSGLSPDSVARIREKFPNLDIQQRMSFETASELGVYERLDFQRRVKLLVSFLIILASACLVMLIKVKSSWKS